MPQSVDDEVRNGHWHLSIWKGLQHLFYGFGTPLNPSESHIKKIWKKMLWTFTVMADLPQFLKEGLDDLIKKSQNNILSSYFKPCSLRHAFHVSRGLQPLRTKTSTSPCVICYWVEQKEWITNIIFVLIYYQGLKDASSSKVTGFSNLHPAVDHSARVEMPASVEWYVTPKKQAGKSTRTRVL